MRSRRTLAAGVAVALATTLAACGGGGAAEPKAGPSAVDTGIPLPTATAAETFAGQGLSQVQLDKIAKTMSAALASGDEKAFLSHIAPGHPRLVAQQRQWFRNVRAVPLTTRKIVVVRPDLDIDSSGKAELTAFVGFSHQVKGADSAPITEWYTFGFERRDDVVRTVEISGAPADTSSGVKYTRYYRQSWDDPAQISTVADDKVVLIGPSADAGSMRRLLPTLSQGVRDALSTVKAAGADVPAGFYSRRWVFNLASPQVPDVFDYYGGLIKVREAAFAAFTTPVRGSYGGGDTGAVLDYESAPLASRIVLNREVLSDRTSFVAEVVRHEMTHAMQQHWEQGGYGVVPTWVTEGLAMHMSKETGYDLASDRSDGRRGLAGAKAMPTKGFYDGSNDVVAQHYGMGMLAIDYLVSKVGLKRVLAAVQELAGARDGDFFKEVGVPRKGFVDAVRKAAGA